MQTRWLQLAERCCSRPCFRFLLCWLHFHSARLDTAREHLGLAKQGGTWHGRSQASNSLPGDVMKGVRHESIIQRFKLDNKTALVTGEQHPVLIADV